MDKKKTTTPPELETALNNSINESLKPIRGLMAEINKPFETLQIKANPLTNNPLLNYIKDLNKKVEDVAKKYRKEETKLKKSWLYNLTIDELEQKELELSETKKELENIKSEFRKMYERLQPSKTSTTIQPARKYYSLECEYSEIKIKTILKPAFDELFEVSNKQLINFLSENITTQIEVKNGVQIMDVLAFFDMLKNKNIINARQYQNALVKSKSVIWCGLPLTAEQFKNARQSLKSGFPKNLPEIN